MWHPRLCKPGPFSPALRGVSQSREKIEEEEDRREGKSLHDLSLLNLSIPVAPQPQLRTARLQRAPEGGKMKILECGQWVGGQNDAMTK